jgi:Fe-S cluster assembly protein SufD
MSALDFLDRIDLASVSEHPHRLAALDAFRAVGFPNRHDEAWHFTDLKTRMRDFDWAQKGDQNIVVLPDLSLPGVVMRDGVWDAASSRPAPFMSRLARGEAVQTDATALVALNAALGQDGVEIVLRDGEAGGAVMLIAQASARSQPIAPRYRVVLGAQSSLTIIEVSQGNGAYLHDPVWDITLGPGAQLDHFRLQDEAVQSVHVATVFVTMAEAARYNGFTLAVGASLARSEFHLALKGARGAVNLNAAQLLTGRQHGDVTTVIAHQAPLCASRQTVKSVIDGTARGVFQGRIEVDRIAQKTDGYQMNQALLLSPDAEIDSKPELEIFADDVKCSHGATIGALDPEQIFYLRSRGIAEAQARAMLIRAFLTEALEPIGESVARPIFEAAIEGWWRRAAL